MPGLAGSFTNESDTVPSVRARPTEAAATFITDAVPAAAFRYVRGRHPSCAANTYASITRLPEAKQTNVVAFEAFSASICARMSGAAGSNGCAETIADARAPSPRR